MVLKPRIVKQNKDRKVKPRYEARIIYKTSNPTSPATLRIKEKNNHE